MLQQKLLIIGCVWVETTSAAGSRMLQLIDFFLQQNYQITFACAAHKTQNTKPLYLQQIEEVTITLNDASFNVFIQQLQPNIVLFDRFMTEEQFGWRVAENCPNALRILDTEDLHCLRKTRELAVKNKVDFTIGDLLNQDITKREIASILRSDLSLIISTFEMDLLQNTFKIDSSILYHLPFLFDRIEETTRSSWRSFKDRNHFIFIGNFLHKPNVSAVLTLKKHIWPFVKKQLPNAELHIYGAYATATQQITQLYNEKDGFLVKGFIENPNQVVENAKVVLAPLTFGAGIKGKLTEAMLLGTPTITTTLGAEGMHQNLPWNGFITDDFKTFIKKAILLYTDENSWKTAQENGVTIINTLYDKEKLTQQFVKRIGELQRNIITHRQQNFLGSLLQYQTLQATKYMSKWIESKNTK